MNPVPRILSGCPLAPLHNPQHPSKPDVVKWWVTLFTAPLDIELSHSREPPKWSQTLLLLSAADAVFPACGVLQHLLL